MDQIFKYGSVEAIPQFNCSGKTVEEWIALQGVPHIGLGLGIMFYGVLIEILYFPCLAAMLKKELIRLSCFKIMFLLGVIDTCAICMNSVITGFLLIDGAVFCKYPTPIYCIGATGLGLWCCACMLAMILAINRLMDIIHPKMFQTYFKGYRTIFVLMLPIAYGLYFICFTPSAVFSSKFVGWYFDPFLFTDGRFVYSNISHTINNVVVVVFSTFLYVAFCFVLCTRLKGTQNHSKFYKQIFLQSALICTATFLASVNYVLMQFAGMPIWFALVGQFGWQMSHGCPVFIYIFFNRTLRRNILGLCNLTYDPRKGKVGSYRPRSSFGTASEDPNMMMY
ncbi:unnamed protein product [Caenorhabditis auriculariae]|uniref:Uncharacterized protein n=1 Tax=Caenorhabditis auriculariae TaxID=2777116 RepID=A0A8S1HNS4_9PELO|nr:unnamed protein product [Caenorhabditis auriculariae]